MSCCSSSMCWQHAKSATAPQSSDSGSSSTYGTMVLLQQQQRQRRAASLTLDQPQRQPCFAPDACCSAKQRPALCVVSNAAFQSTVTVEAAAVPLHCIGVHL